RVMLSIAGDRIPIPRIAQASIDPWVLAFSIAVALLTTVLFSLAPAAQLMRANLTGALKEGASNIARGRHGVRSALVVGQITLGLVVLVGAEMLIASFVYLMQRDPGFRPDHLLTFNVSLSGYKVTGEIEFSDRLKSALRAIPGVQTAATGMPLPLQGHEMTV